MEDRPLSAIIRELVTGLSGLIRSEIKLARTEMTQNIQDLISNLARVVASATLMWLGILALTAFVIMGLGDLLGGHYWLSALSVGIIFVATGALFTFHAIKKMRKDLTLPRTLDSLGEDQQLLSESASEIVQKTE